MNEISGATPLNNTKQAANLSETAKSSNETKNVSIFQDTNKNNIVDAEDFGNNETLMTLVEHQGWMGKAWQEVGDQLNKLLKGFNKNSNGDIKQSLETITENCDLKNGSEVALALIAISNEDSLGSVDFGEYANKLFNGNVSNVDMLRDGGSRIIELKDGTHIEMNFSINDSFSEYYGSTEITHPDGTKETYNDEGQPLENRTR